MDGHVAHMEEIRNTYRVLMNSEKKKVYLEYLHVNENTYYALLSPLITVVRCHNIEHVTNDQHDRTIIAVLTKHEISPWWWFLREPKHVGATLGILIVLIFLWFYNCVHQLEP